MLRFLPICLIAMTAFEVRIAETADPNPAQVLEKAIYTEQTVGDLDTAVRLYQSIAAKGKTNGDAAARAQFRIGLAHLKRGDRAAAAKAFQLLIEQHPHQKRLVAQARNLMPPVIDEAIERIRENYVDSLDDNDELINEAVEGWDLEFSLTQRGAIRAGVAHRRTAKNIYHRVHFSQAVAQSGAPPHAALIASRAACFRRKPSPPKIAYTGAASDAGSRSFAADMTDPPPSVSRPRKTEEILTGSPAVVTIGKSGRPPTGRSGRS